MRMTKRKDRAGGDRSARGLGDDRADKALVALVALGIDRVGIECRWQDPKQVSGVYIGKVAIRGRVAFLDGDDEKAIASNRAGIDDQARGIEALQIGMAALGRG